MKSPSPRTVLVSCAVLGALGCRSTPQGPPAAPVDVTPASSSAPAAPRVIGAPANPPGTAHPPMRASWADALLDEGCKPDAQKDESGLPCPSPGGEKNCCAGKNMCKGTSGCRSAKSSCAGLNDCKGQGTSCPSTPPMIIPRP